MKRNKFVLFTTRNEIKFTKVVNNENIESSHNLTGLLMKRVDDTERSSHITPQDLIESPMDESNINIYNFYINHEHQLVIYSNIRLTGLPTGFSNYVNYRIIAECIENLVTFDKLEDIYNKKLFIEEKHFICINIHIHNEKDIEFSFVNSLLRHIKSANEDVNVDIEQLNKYSIYYTSIECCDIKDESTKLTH